MEYIGTKVSYSALNEQIRNRKYIYRGTNELIRASSNSNIVRYLYAIPLLITEKLPHETENVVKNGQIWGSKGMVQGIDCTHQVIHLR